MDTVGVTYDWSVKIPKSATTAYGVQANVHSDMSENAHLANLSSRCRGRLIGSDLKSDFEKLRTRGISETCQQVVGKS